ncbi:MAG: hypothetical protein HYR71_06050 [Chloroflexi bacterium]|nr:hypothetical protein [Chloroflexota bacterium]
MRALVIRPDGQRAVRDVMVGEVAQAGALGTQLAQRMLDNGARALMESADGGVSTPRG